MKKTIAVIRGGDSSEFEVSLKSGEQVFNSIDRSKFMCFKVLIKGSMWVVELNENLQISIDKNDFSFTLNLAQFNLLDAKDEIQYQTIDETYKFKFDCAFIVIHGTPGENGILQAYFDLIGLPYTSSSVITSALCFNKSFCKQFLNNQGIKSAKGIKINRNEKYSIPQIIDYLGLPCFIKPNNGGSSCGISKVKHENEMVAAIDKAFGEDEQILIEEYIAGTEITCGLVRLTNKEIVFPLTEIVSKNEFFDYEAKYTPAKADEITPARISDTLTQQCKDLSLRIAQILECRGIVRIDYILRNNEIFFLEVNIVPGMTKNSLVPQQIAALGINHSELYTAIIEDSIN